jgi:hypothetical protein
LKVATDHLKFKSCISDEERAKVLEQQMKKYYEPRSII